MSWLSFRKKRQSWEDHAGEIILTAMRHSSNKYVWAPNSHERVMERLRDFAEVEWADQQPSAGRLIQVIAQLLLLEGTTPETRIPLDPQFALAEAA